ncbi:putative aminoacrylate peracid reductase RutC [mine drainage metagenome]|uniref:Putative aminoacrylate peracid reductase RutC n=1 Tax=mine drainage metagenome TaxID=410659 RepID=A0A1J5RCZ4_9ZZZZ
MARSLHLQLMALEELLAKSSGGFAQVLGVSMFGADAVPGLLREHSVPAALVRAAVVGADGTDGVVCEVWSSEQAVRSGRTEQARWRATDSVMFVSVDVDPRLPIEEAAESAYRALFDTVEAEGHPHLLRVWNHVADINGDADGLERYRRFNIGRQQAFVERRRQVVGSGVPAASAVGARADAPLVVFALAARQAPRGIENPRQISAYHYPAAYGPRAPTFSRANLFGDDDPVLFVSGTASIVGHQTQHPGDVREQTRETLRNIAALVEVACSAHGVKLELGDLQFKAYLRDAADRAVVHEELAQAVGSSPDVLFVQADICRRDLLVEIEAVAWSERERAWLR